MATVLGYGWALFMGIILGVLFASFNGGDLSLNYPYIAYGVVALITAICRATLGLAQWFVLSGYRLQKAYWWILTHSVAAAGWTTLGFIIYPVYPINFLTRLMLSLIPIGAFTGILLVWIIRQSACGQE